MKLEEAIRNQADIRCDNTEQRNTVTRILTTGGCRSLAVPDLDTDLVVRITHSGCFYYGYRTSTYCPTIPATQFIKSNS